MPFQHLWTAQTSCRVCTGRQGDNTAHTTRQDHLIHYLPKLNEFRGWQSISLQSHLSQTDSPARMNEHHSLCRHWTPDSTNHVCGSFHRSTTFQTPILHGAHNVLMMLEGAFQFEAFGNFNDPSAGSPTETLLRLLLPLNDQVWSSSRKPQKHLRAPTATI